MSASHPLTSPRAPQIGRVPPHSVDAEEQTLSACLLDGGETLNLAVEKRLVPASFYVPANRLIFARLGAMQDARRPIDVAVLAEELRASGELESVGGFPYVMRISSAVSTTAGAAYFIEKVRELALLRDLIRAATGIVEDTYNYTGELDAHIGKAEGAILAATQGRISGESTPVHELCEGSLSTFAAAAANPGQISGLATGYRDLDMIIGGLRPSEVIVLAGRPSCGKTSLAANIAENIACPRPGQAPQTVWFASLEMSKPQLGNRLIAQRARIPIKRALAGFFKPGSPEWGALQKARDDYKKAKFFIDDEARMTPSMLAAKARRIHQRHGLGLIVVDYLQLVAPTDARAMREQQVAEASRAIKALAKELNVPVILLAQLNRASTKENRQPVLSDLRESGSIEQDADVVLMLAPQTEDEGQQVACPTMQAFVRKNRNGAVGDCLLTFSPEITRFDNHIGGQL